MVTTFWSHLSNLPFRATFRFQVTCSKGNAGDNFATHFVIISIHHGLCPSRTQWRDYLLLYMSFPNKSMAPMYWALFSYIVLCIVHSPWINSKLARVCDLATLDCDDMAWLLQEGSVTGNRVLLNRLRNREEHHRLLLLGTVAVQPSAGTSK